MKLLGQIYLKQFLMALCRRVCKVSKVEMLCLQRKCPETEKEILTLRFFFPFLENVKRSHRDQKNIVLKKFSIFFDYWVI